MGFRIEMSADSIAIYSKTEGLQAMFYSNYIESSQGKTSATNFSNPMLPASWETHIDEKIIEARKWESTIGYTIYKIKKLE